MLSVLFAALLCCASVAAQAADKETAYERVMRTGVLRCGYIVWQPYIIKDANTGKMSGMSYDVFEAIGKNMGLKIEWTQEVLVGQQAEALNTGKIDAVCGDWPLNPVSAKYVDYTDGYAYFPMYLYQKKGGKHFADMNAVNHANVTISGMDGDISLLIADKKFPNAKKVQVPSSADPTEINLNAMTGKADLASNDPFSVSFFNAANGNQLVPVFPDKPLAILKTGASLKKEDGNLLRVLNEGIANLIATDEINEILDKDDPQHFMKRPNPAWKN